MQKNYSWNPSTCICENKKYLKSIADTLANNTIATNVTSTASINFHSKKVKNCYILKTVLLVIILLLIKTIIFYDYAKQRNTDALTV